MVSLPFHRHITYSHLFLNSYSRNPCPPFLSENTALTLVICSLPPPPPETRFCYGRGVVFKLTARTQSASVPMEGISIRGASGARNPTVGRLRRNALTTTSVTDSGRVPTVGTKTLDVWRHFVNRRWNPDARFLNLEVSSTGVLSVKCRGSKSAVIVTLQSMLDDPELAKHGLLPPGAPGSTAREASVIFKLASNLKPPVSFSF